MRKGPGKDEEGERRNEIRTMTGKNIYEMHDFYVMGGMFNERSVGQMYVEGNASRAKIKIQKLHRKTP